MEEEPFLDSPSLLLLATYTNMHLTISIKVSLKGYAPAEMVTCKIDSPECPFSPVLCHRQQILYPRIKNRNTGILMRCAATWLKTAVKPFSHGEPICQSPFIRRSRHPLSQGQNGCADPPLSRCTGTYYMKPVALPAPVPIMPCVCGGVNVKEVAANGHQHEHERL